RAGRADRGEDRNQYHDSGRTDAGGGYRNRTVCRICRRAKRLLMEEIKGYVEHIVYRNEDNGYTVFHLNNEDGEVTCVGNFHFIEEGELLRMEGEYTTHKLYGLQFAVQTSEV